MGQQLVQNSDRDALKFPEPRPHGEENKGQPYPDLDSLLYNVSTLMIHCIIRRGGYTIMRSQVLKWGNSLAVRVPKPIADQAKLKAGDSVEIDVDTGGAVRLHAVGKIPTLAQLVAQITPQNRYGEISTGTERGKEAVEW